MNKKYRVLLFPLAYNHELKPDAPYGLDSVYARPGDITELYPELTQYPQYVEALIRDGYIEEVIEPKIVRPSKSEDKETK